MGEHAKTPFPQRAALTPHASRLLSELRGVMKDPSDADAVHDARVSARRLLAALEIRLPESEAGEELRGRLDKCVRRLGRVRNLDVAERFLRRGPAAEAAARRALAEKLRRQAKKARRRLGSWLTPGRIRRVKEAVARALAGPAAPEPGRISLAPRLGAVMRLAAQGRPMDDPERAHELRRQIRFLRYQQESIAGCYPAAADAAFRAMFVRLQDAAGEWHDRFAIDRAAVRFARKRGGVKGLAALRRRLAVEMRARATRFERELAGLLRRSSELAGTDAANRP
ncbi:MAG: CHAD domain-containing protein [Planctomycetia bacterium]|nr:CHAD domain-containing protein [Planctomycetia bacterium]